MSPPKVSIGLPVYNGEEFLAKAIESILGQTFTDFELIISDNASTDKTAMICQTYAAQDARIRYYRNATNIGGAKNGNRTFLLSEGQYYRRAAHDDICAPTLLEKCVAVLDQNPEIVLCYTQTINIDQQGQELDLVTLSRATSDQVTKRFRDLAFRNDFCEPSYGVMRSDILRQTRPEQDFTGSDRVLLCELAFHGKFHEVAEPLFYKRHHAKNIYLDWRARMAWFNPELKGKITFPNWLQFLNYLQIIHQGPLSPLEKGRCYLTMLEWLGVHGKSMVKDVTVALTMALHSKEWRKNVQSYNWE
ncbi:MAG: glycosyltransferase [Caldilineaceae bacterium]|nr:glycosyltransferase [Caldilineaceae bacterium]